MSSEQSAHADELELQDRIVVAGSVDGQATNSAAEREFEVVGIIEDSDSGTRYAVCYCEPADEFIVTSKTGALVEDEALAQEILNDFLDQAADAVAEDQQ
ncbi:MAG TPA: hypothetical protein VKT51_04305 [Candidatus Eremiobacteraceae bacterium]|nr:hypothetical protein [Candidatus Eremiobacteraceae bacterium]